MKDMRKLEEIWAKFVYEDELDQVHADSTIIAISQGPKNKLLLTTPGLECSDTGLLLTDESKLGEDGMLTVELRHNAESDLQKEAFWGVVSFELSSIPECNSSQFKGFKIKHTDFTYASAEEDVTFAPTNARSRMIPSNARPLLTKE